MKHFQTLYSSLSGHKPDKLIGKVVFYSLLCCIFIFLCLYAFLSIFGFPNWLLSECAENFSKGNFALEVKAVKLAPLNNFILRGVRLYRKKVIGPAAVDAKQIVITIDPLAFVKEVSCLRGIKISNGIFRPSMAKGPDLHRDARPVLKTLTQIEIEHCTVQDINIERLSGKFCSDGSILKFINVETALRNENLHGDLKGNAIFNPDSGSLDAHIETKIDPHLLLPLLKTQNLLFLRELINQFDFAEATPYWEMDFTQVFKGDCAFSLNGKFRLDDCTYRGVDALRTDGSVKVNFSETNSTVAIDPLLVVRHDGIVNVGFTVDNMQEIVQFDGASTIAPEALSQMIGILTNNFWEIFQFNGPVKITAKGIADYRNSDRTDFGITAKIRDMKLLKFAADECSFEMQTSATTYILRNIRSKIYDGKLTGSAAFIQPSENSTNLKYTIEGKFKDGDFGKLANALSEKVNNDYMGKISGHTRVTGLMGTGNGATARGEGAISIDDGRVFMFPLFGGLTKLLAKIIPGIDFVLRQSDAEADFVIADGKIHSDKVQIKGDIFSLIGHGDYYFNGKLDFNVQVWFFKPHTFVSKLIRIPTYLISKFFELKLTGDIGHPHWYPINFSVPELLEKLGLKKKGAKAVEKVTQ